MDTLFVDTGAWLAVTDQSDQYNRIALPYFRELLKGRYRLVTTNLVVGESYELIRRRAGQGIAIQFLSVLRRSQQITTIYADAALERQAERLLRQFGDQPISYVDAVSFAYMQQQRITSAFAFDHHFRVLGFLIYPPAAV